MTADNRNVIDHYKHLSDLLIQGDLDQKRHNFSLLFWNLGIDFNLASGIRNSNAFLAKTVYIYGKKKFDHRGTVGTHHYEHLQHVKVLEDIKDLPPDCHWVGMDNIEGAKPIDTYKWHTDKHILICFGMEKLGLPQEVIDECDDLVYIRQYGSVRSLNVGVASGIACFSLTSQIHSQ